MKVPKVDPALVFLAVVIVIAALQIALDVLDIINRQ